MYFIFLIWIVLALVGYLTKTSGRSIGNIKIAIKYSVIRNLFAVIFTLTLAILGNSTVNFSLPMILCAGLLGFVTAVDLVVGLLLSKNSVTALLTIANQGGAVIFSTLVGILFFSNAVRPIQWLFFALFMVASYILCGTSKEIYKDFSIKTVLLLVTHFICGGLATVSLQVFAKVCDGDKNVFLALSYSITELLMLLVLLFTHFENSHSNDRISLKLKFFALMMGIVTALYQLFTVMAAEILDPIVQFSFIAVGGIIANMLVGILFFKEKLTLKSGFAVVASMLSVVMINYFN